MTKQSHDHNFKNLFLDFPKETLELLFLLLWLVEFQEDKAKFSIYKLLRYTTDLMEAYPHALVIPTVLFTDRTKWRKDILRKLQTKLNDRLFLHFEYVFFKLFDFNARDYYNINNPVVKILLPKMNYKKDERIEVIRQAYSGLFQLVSHGLFDKYVDFIDVYAKVSKEEQENLYHDIIQHKETAMLAQYIRDKGMQQGMQQGIQQGIIQNTKENIIEVLELRFGKISPEIIDKINQINDPAKLKELHKKGIQIKEFDSFGFIC